MAILQVHRDDMNGANFPPLCMRCGAPASKMIDVTLRGTDADDTLFSRRHEYPLTFPVCESHTRMWRTQSIVVNSAMLAPVIFTGSLVLLIVFHLALGLRSVSGWEVLAGLILVVGLLGSVFYALVIMLVWKTMTIRAVDGDEEWLTLNGVSPFFVEACRRPGPAAPAVLASATRPNPVVAPPRRPLCKHPRRDEWTLKAQLRNWGFAAFLFGAVAVSLPFMGFQWRILTQLGPYAPVVGFAVGFVGAVLLVVSNYVRDPEGDDEGPA